MQGQFHLCYPLQATCRGSHRLQILLFACFSPASSDPCMTTLSLFFLYHLPRHVTSNGKSLFPPKYSSVHNFLATSGMVHPPHTSLFVSLLSQCQFLRRQLSTFEVAICVHCPGASAVHPELVFPKLLLQTHH